MWDKLITFSDDKQFVIAKLSDEQVTDSDFNKEGLENALQLIDAKDYFLLQDEVTRFINSAKEMKSEAYEGITIAEVRDASIEVLLSDQNMLASMVVTGAYRGKPLKGPQIVHALAKAFVTKGINKLALKKVLVVSHQLGAGETFTQVVAKGKAPIQGADKFTPLVDDPTKQVLAPRDTNNDGKVDMLNLGDTITVAKGQPLMRLTPATKGTPGLTVQETLFLVPRVMNPLFILVSEQKCLRKIRTYLLQKKVECRFFRREGWMWRMHFAYRISVLLPAR